MTAPTDHNVTITNQYNRQIRGKVVYIQPKEERWREDRAVVHVVTRDWLDPYTYPAIYFSPTQTVSGTYTVHRYIREDDQWRLMGAFDRAPESEQGE